MADSGIKRIAEKMALELRVVRKRNGVDKMGYYGDRGVLGKMHGKMCVASDKLCTHNMGLFEQSGILKRRDFGEMPGKMCVASDQLCARNMGRFGCGERLSISVFAESVKKNRFSAGPALSF